MNITYIQKIQAQYGIGEHFARLYLESWFGTADLSEEEAEFKLQNPTLKMWFDFAVQCISRGRQIAQLVKPYLPLHASRYLDVGCGHGGFLIGFSELGLDVYGMDLNPQFIPYSRANLKDHNLPEERAQVGDILDVSLSARLGKFDVITCNDVIEHVNNVPLALTHMIEMLSSKGILAIQIPNKDYIGFVQRDGHYNLFGIVLLQHEQAKEYYDTLIKEEYGVGEYYELDYYTNKMIELGCETFRLPPVYTQKTGREEARTLIHTFTAFIQFVRQKKGTSLKIKLSVSVRYFLYLAGLGWRGLLAMMFKSRRAAFRTRYLTDFWFVVAAKK
ncbi:MAG: class I SAM-dependent methyltransferase [Anaerolineales bacterium]|nr:class I SAM-dependent methyltransferase [Anaerolineales bacterium]